MGREMVCGSGCADRKRGIIMIVQKLMTTDMQLDIEGVTLLTKGEAEALPVELRKCSECWWLRSPGFIDDKAAFVYGDTGNVDDIGISADHKLGVRPALCVNLKSIDLQIRDVIKIFGYDWTVISDSLILCDDTVGESPFRTDRNALDANDYETSDINKWLDEWYMDQITLA